MWTTLCTISCVMAVWSGVLVGATDNSHVVLKVRAVVGERVVPTTLQLSLLALRLDVLASDLLYGLSTMLNGGLRVKY